MSIKAKPPRLATSAARDIDHFGKLICPASKPIASEIQDVAAAIVAERYRLRLPLARVVVELAQLGGQLG